MYFYPGDKWGVGNNHSSQGALIKYSRDYDEVLNKNEFCNHLVYSKEKLLEVFENFKKRVFKNHSLDILLLLSLVGKLKKTKIYLWDLNLSCVLDFKGLKFVELREEECEMSMGSDSLYFCLKYDWGADTLAINGRYQVASKHLVDSFNGCIFPLMWLSFSN